MDTATKFQILYYIIMTVGLFLAFFIVGFILSKIFKKLMKDEDEYLNEDED